MFFTINVYSVTKKNCDSSAIIANLFEILCDDIQQVPKEIWFSINDVSKHISSNIRNVKILELLVIGIFLASISDLHLK
jgi:hypothetical protein